MRKLFTTLALILATPAFAQQQPSTVTNMPFASTPFSGSEIIYVIQNGGSKKTTLGQLSSSGTGLFAASGANSDITSLSGLTSLTLSGLPACTPGSAVAPVLAGQAFICNGMILIAQ